MIATHNRYRSVMGRWGSPHRCVLSTWVTCLYDYEIHAPIHSASLGCRVVGDRTELAETCGRNVSRIEARIIHQQEQYIHCTRCREFPIRAELIIVDGLVVGVAFHANLQARP